MSETDNFSLAELSELLEQESRRYSRRLDEEQEVNGE